MRMGVVGVLTLCKKGFDCTAKVVVSVSNVGDKK
jgi:hypothetical protein